MTKAIYAGTFDPPTLGHLWVIKAAAQLFDKLEVTIGLNPTKQVTFDLAERVEMLRWIIPWDHRSCSFKSTTFDNRYLVDYAASEDVQIIVRGIRNEADFLYEQMMCNVNRDINKDIMTVFLIPPRDLCEVSSSFVKGLVGPEGWQDVVKKYLPDYVLTCFMKRFSGGTSSANEDTEALQ